MDYAKFVRKDMPLAVPTQKRPPGKYASHPYPVLIDEDIYQAVVKPLDITLIQILKDTLITEAYGAAFMPLDFKLESALKRKDIDDLEAYIGIVKPLDFKLESIIKRMDIGYDGYQPTVKALNFNRRRVLIEYANADDEIYKVVVKPLDFTFIKGL